MRKLLTKRKRRGSTTIIAVAVTFAILIFFWMFMELQQFFDAQYNVEVRCQRAVNACLEYFMDDRLRADGYNCLCVEDGTTRHADKIYTIQYADQNGKGLYSYLDNTLGITGVAARQTAERAIARTLPAKLYLQLPTATENIRKALMASITAVKSRPFPLM